VLITFVNKTKEKIVSALIEVFCEYILNKIFMSVSGG